MPEEKMDLKEMLRSAILQAAHANNDYDGWQITDGSFDEQRDKIEAHDTDVILDAIWPQIQQLLWALDYIDGHDDAEVAAKVLKGEWSSPQCCFGHGREEMIVDE